MKGAKGGNVNWIGLFVLALCNCAMFIQHKGADIHPCTIIDYKETNMTGKTTSANPSLKEYIFKAIDVTVKTKSNLTGSARVYDNGVVYFDQLKEYYCVGCKLACVVYPLSADQISLISFERYTNETAPYNFAANSEGLDVLWILFTAVVVIIDISIVLGFVDSMRQKSLNF